MGIRGLPCHKCNYFTFMAAVGGKERRKKGNNNSVISNVCEKSQQC